ncbi:MAG: hypothetical protein QM785_07575 [Pyrinomonadaceae bacterium]
MRKDVLMMGVITIFLIGAAYFGASYYRSSVQKEVKSSAPAPATANSASLVRDDSPTLGPADAKVTLVEFYDPECESCRVFRTRGEKDHERLRRQDPSRRQIHAAASKFDASCLLHRGRK